MPRREPIPRPTERRVWMESIGYCLNPACEDNLFDNGAYVGETAHIVPVEHGGNNEFANLLGLCRKCHRREDLLRNEDTVETLQAWKNERGDEIASRFSRRFKSFELLKDHVVPLLRRNRTIYEVYGPGGSETIGDGRHALWAKSEPEIVVNNRRILLAIEKNMDLIHKENHNILNRFRLHVQEFVNTRGDDVRRVQLFPSDLNSLFGEEEVRVDPPPNLSALENWIERLLADERFVDIELEPEQVIRYWEGEEVVSRNLANRPDILQVYWTKRLYRPQRTEMRLRTLVFLLKWLTDNRISYEFPDVSRLARITVGRSHPIQLAYEYILSISDLHRIKRADNLIVVNLYHWNGGRFTDEARTYSRKVGIRLFTQNEFFVFAHKELKSI